VWETILTEIKISRIPGISKKWKKKSFYRQKRDINASTRPARSGTTCGISDLVFLNAFFSKINLFVEFSIFYNHFRHGFFSNEKYFAEIAKE
jgi:hypothetical protein